MTSRTHFRGIAGGVHCGFRAGRRSGRGSHDRRRKGDSSSPRVLGRLPSTGHEHLATESFAGYALSEKTYFASRRILTMVTITLHDPSDLSIKRRPRNAASHRRDLASRLTKSHV